MLTIRVLIAILDILDFTATFAAFRVILDSCVVLKYADRSMLAAVFQSVVDIATMEEHATKQVGCVTVLEDSLDHIAICVSQSHERGHVLEDIADLLTLDVE